MREWSKTLGGVENVEHATIKFKDNRLIEQSFEEYKGKKTNIEIEHEDMRCRLWVREKKNNWFQIRIKVMGCISTICQIFYRCQSHCFEMLNIVEWDCCISNVQSDCFQCIDCGIWLQKFPIKLHLSNKFYQQTIAQSINNNNQNG